MKPTNYFFRYGLVGIVLILISLSSYCQEDEILLKETVLLAGEEVKLPVDCDMFVQIDLTCCNTFDGKSVFWYTCFSGGQELSEKKIGPLKFRTYEVGSKSSGNNKKTITLDCSGIDEILVHVDKGKMEFNLVGRTKY